MNVEILDADRGHTAFTKVGMFVVVVLGILVSGCPLEDLQGPESVVPNGQATFTMTMRYDGTNQTGGTPFIVAEVPLSWTFDNASFQGVSLGSPVSGTGSVAHPDYSGCASTTWPPLRPDYHRIFIADGYYSVGPGDYADVTVSFNVGPDVGTKTLRFWALAYYECKYEPAEIQVHVGAKPIPATTPIGLFSLVMILLVVGGLIVRRTL